MTQTIRTAMIANRGEVAVRFFRAATELELRTVAVYSHEDRLSIHRYKADEAWQIGEAGEPFKAYSDIEAILEVAKARNVDAIHPGYGFLSENARFAERCAEEGIIFIGPTPDALRRLGDKVSARALAQAADVPVIPGTPKPVESEEEAIAFAEDAGYPLMVKAAYGGGGRGMRRVQNQRELLEGLASARREAESAFGSGELFIEKLIVQPRHIEVQLLGDSHGNLVHLYERDCSVQRRHQKVMEVAPAINLADETKEALYSAALKIGKTAGLSSAATVEFLVAPDGSYYFIEVNPRLQVEHTITEMITGIDIVQCQLRLAAGASLPDLGIEGQDSVSRYGAAIQARVTTEDPTRDFAPDTGRVITYRSAAGFGIRLDTGIAGTGAIITPHYDSLLVKVSAHALDHELATAKLSRSLKEFRIRGVATNIPFLDNILSHEDFLKGQVDTEFLTRTPALFRIPRRRNRANRLLIAIADTLVNGPPGVDRHLPTPGVTLEVNVPPRLPQQAQVRTPKQILDEDGPEAVATWLRQQKGLCLTDTTLRDAHQSLLATRMRTYDMVQVAGAMEDRLPGLFSAEVWGGATFDVAYRFLREDPWERLAKLRKSMPNTLLQMLLRGSNAVGYSNYPEEVVRRFVRAAAAGGVDVFRIFDCFNQIEAMRACIEETRAAGKIAEVSICFTGDLQDASRSLYTLDYYRRKAREAAEAGAHIVAIKDMAGLLKPGQVPELVEALRDEVDLPLHLHMHDSAGNGVATLLSASRSGVDAVDVAIASMSGLTSQPNMNSLVAALDGQDRSTGMKLQQLQELSDYWEAVRTQYAPFESGLMASGADVYHHEIPGGQYSNLKPQALAVGLSEQWADIRETYRDVNFALGDIVKVTPSSKVVGDFALWLVRQGLSVDELLASDRDYDFPKSVVDFFQGAIGVPEGGFPEGLRTRILGAECGPAPTGIATTNLPPYDWSKGRADLETVSTVPVTEELELSYALYPREVLDYLKHRKRFGDVSLIDTNLFFYGLPPDEEVTVDIEPGKSLVITRTAIGELRSDGKRQVHFMLNGQPRSVRVTDRGVEDAESQTRQADPLVPGQVAAPMPGQIWSLGVEVGDEVAEGDSLGVVEAMKLETHFRAAKAGRVKELVVGVGQKVQAGDLLVVID